MRSPFIKSNWAGSQKIMAICFRATILPGVVALVVVGAVSFAYSYGLKSCPLHQVEVRL